MGGALDSTRQFPQGGINPVKPLNRRCIANCSKKWVYTAKMFEYLLQPVTGYVTSCQNVWCVGTQSRCIGQKQKWFLLQLMCSDADINVQHSSTPEFDGWRWVSFWYPVRQVVSFKRDVYRRVMKEFAGVVMSMQESAGSAITTPPIDVKRIGHALYAHSVARNCRKSGECTASE